MKKAPYLLLCYFSYFSRKMCCGYSLEAPQGDTDEYYNTFSVKNMPALVAQLDAHLTGDQEVAGAISPSSGNFFSWRLVMKYFLLSFSPFR